MAHISIKNLTIEFPLYDFDARSLKHTAIKRTVGGILTKKKSSTVTVKALDNISFEINDGERIGLLGHNGAGKTTLLRALSGIYKPTNGSISISGKVSTLLNTSAGMHIHATGIQNIYFRGFLLGLTKYEIEERIDDIVTFSELGEFIHLPVRTYSAGMYARLAFAITTSISPEILLIDEGIGAGDANFHDKAQARIEGFKNQANIMVFSSHSEALLSLYCSKVIKLENGQISTL